MSSDLGRRARRHTQKQGVTAARSRQNLDKSAFRQLAQGCRNLRLLLADDPAPVTRTSTVFYDWGKWPLFIWT